MFCSAVIRASNVYHFPSLGQEVGHKHKKAGAQGDRLFNLPDCAHFAPLTQLFAEIRIEETSNETGHQSARGR